MMAVESGSNGVVESNDENLNQSCIKNNLSIKNHKCSECGKLFKRLSHFKEHQFFHSGQRPYKCSFLDCGNSYKRKDHLRRHVLRVHKPAEESSKLLQCTYKDCDKSYSLKSSLDKHINNFHTNKYHCTEKGCKESFNKKHKLKHHEFAHKGVKPYQCHVTECLKQFTQMGHLRRHLKQHDGYQCSVEDCREVFEKWSQLRRHRACLHRKESRCSICGKVFSHANKLREHSSRCMRQDDSGTESYVVSCDESSEAPASMHPTQKTPLNTKYVCQTPSGGIEDLKDKNNPMCIDHHTKTAGVEKDISTNDRNSHSHNKINYDNEISDGFFYKKIILNPSSNLLKNKLISSIFSKKSNINTASTTTTTTTTTNNNNNRNNKAIENQKKSETKTGKHGSMEAGKNTRKQTYMCTYSLCRRVYTERRNLLNHVRVNHLGLLHICHKCRRTFASKQKLLFHAKSCGRLMLATRKQGGQMKRRRVVVKESAQEAFKSSSDCLRRLQERLKHKALVQRRLGSAADGMVDKLRRNSRKERLMESRKAANKDSIKTVAGASETATQHLPGMCAKIDGVEQSTTIPSQEPSIVYSASKDTIFKENNLEFIAL